MIVAEKYNYQAIYCNIIDKITSDLDDWLDSYDPIVPIGDRNLTLLQRIPVSVHKHISDLSVRQVKGIYKFLRNRKNHELPFIESSDPITSIEDYVTKTIELDFSKRYI
jgi:hypothetical protein